MSKDSSMATTHLGTSLAKLVNGKIEIFAGGAFPQPGCASVRIVFANGSWLHAHYWRIIQGGKQPISSFDHEQKYGLPAPIDAVKEFQERLHDKVVAAARITAKSGDLLLSFSDNIELQVFNFTGYEVWDIHFPDNTAEYSNHVQLS